LLIIGESVREAFALAIKVEKEAQVCCLALSVGLPVSLTTEQVEMICRRCQSKRR